MRMLARTLRRYAIYLNERIIRGSPPEVTRSDKCVKHQYYPTWSGIRKGSALNTGDDPEIIVPARGAGPTNQVSRTNVIPL